MNNFIGLNIYTSYNSFYKNLAIGFLLVFFSIFQLSAQNQKNIKLDWKEAKVFKIINDETISVPYVDARQLDFKRRLPLSNHKWLIPANTAIDSLVVTNVSYEVLSPDQYGDLDLKQIPTTLTYQWATNKDRNETYAHFNLIPLVKDGATIKKVTSLNLYYKTFSQKSTPKAPLTSVLAEGNWYKFAVERTGVHKITRSFLNDLGIDLNGVNPKNIQLYGNGGTLLPYRIGDFRYEDLQENAIYVKDGEDGSFDDDDFILFYAQGPHSWQYNNTVESVKHIHNIYDDYAYYFIRIGDTDGKRIISSTPIDEDAAQIFTDYFEFWVHEADEYNIAQLGQQFFGHKFDYSLNYSIKQTFDNLDTAQPVTIRVKAAAQSDVPSTMSVNVNGVSLNQLNFPPTFGSITLAYGDEINGSVNVDNETLTINFDYDKNGDSGAKAYLDYVEVIYKRKLVVNDRQFNFMTFDQINKTIAFELQNPNNIYQVWDISDFINPQLISNQSTSNTFMFKAPGNTPKTYCVLNESDFYTPVNIENSHVTNQNIHGITQADYLIITNRDLQDSAEELADFHRTRNNLNVKVVPLYQIYNEFASGSSDITAIRDFIKYVYDQSNGQLKYVLMYGDASFDFKGIQYDTAPVPAFQSYESFSLAYSYVTDDFFVIVNDPNEGDLDDTTQIHTQDVAVSRIPVNNSSEADAFNNKLFKYYNTDTFGDWHNNLLLIADDVDEGSDQAMQINQEALADDIKVNKPLMNIKKLWMDAFPQETVAGGSRYPEVNEAINKSVENGVLMINYVGHSGESGLSAERVLEVNQIRNWQNLNKLNLFTVMSCEFARYDNPERPDTAGEVLIRHPHGGSVHEIATARAIFTDNGYDFNETLIPELLAYDNSYMSIAEHLRVMKNSFTNLQQRYFLTSFGDTYTKLALAKPDIKITHMNGESILQRTDTIKGLSKVSFNGLITDQNGEKDTSFNGELTLTVFDKAIERQTLDNQGLGVVMTFDTQESKLFKGKASITNGEFYIEFIAPKDLRIAYGEGKLSFYAQSDTYEKGGYNTDITVGGIDTNAPEDNQGPDIKLYMNDTSFRDGDNTDESPLFMAFIEDEHGINTSLSSVDHDITAVLDDDYQNAILLNEYFITALDDFTKGELNYRFENLSPGEHKITLTAYDNYNNSSTATLRFVVEDNTELEITELLNFPNPFSESTTFSFSHNRSNQYLDVELQVFTTYGQMVKQLNQRIFATTKTSKDIIWDGSNNSGVKVKKGIYIYRLGLTDPNTKTETEAYNKLIISN